VSRAAPDGRQVVELLPIGVGRRSLERLRAELDRRLDVRTHIATPIEPRPDWYDEERSQYRADVILDALVNRQREPGAWTLGVLDGDLYVPGFNFVFGQATVHGCCAVIGLTRLRPEFNGEPPGDPRFHHRLLTEAIHELGHVAGLGHCPDPRCALHFSSTIADTDAKGPDLCDRCRQAVRPAAS
jgi:archaemetzincin